MAVVWTALLLRLAGSPLPAEMTLPVGQTIDGRVPPLVAYRPETPATRYPVQLLQLGPWCAEGARFAAVIPPVEPDRAELKLEITAADDPFADPFEFTDDGRGALTLTENGQPVLVYRYGDTLPAGVPADRQRSSYVHPLYSLDGTSLTDDFPRDHYHHRGYYFAWPGTYFDGVNRDLWHIQGVRSVFSSFTERETGPVCAVFGVRNQWLLGERKVMEETLWYRVWRAGETGRSIDTHCSWRVEPGVEVMLKPKDDKGYGGLNLRFAPRQKTVITTAEGPIKADGVLTVTPWADLSAIYPGVDAPQGIAVFCAATNPGFPNEWLLRNYGFLGVSWPGLKTYVFDRERPLEVDYRLWVHRGDATTGEVARAYAAYAGQVKAELAR